MFSASFSGIEEALQKLEDETMEALPGVVETWGQVIAERARDVHPYTDRTGDLTASIEAAPARHVGERVEGGVVAGTSYASYVEEGTDRARPYPYLEPAARDTEPYVEQLADQELRRAATAAGWRVD